MSFSWDQALAWRMQRHYLILRTRSANLAKVVDRLRGLHAQLMSSVELALWARIDDLEQGAVADALWHKRTLVKLWAMRSTLHVLPAHDLGVWIAGLGIWKPGGWPYKDPEAIPLAGFIDQALRGKMLTRAQLAAAVTQLGATPKMVKGLHGSWGEFLKPASFFGYLCSAPSEGQEVRFTHPETWLRKPLKKPDAEKAFDLLTERYLGTYGPATAVDLGRWWGLNQTQAKRRLAALGDKVSEVTIGSKRYWMLDRDVAELGATEPVDVVRLLPAFDQWVVCAARQAPDYMDSKFLSRIYRQQGWVSPVLLVNGRMAGIWKHEHHGRKLSIEIEPFARLPRWARAQAAEEAERLARFFKGDLSLKIRNYKPC